MALVSAGSLGATTLQQYINQEQNAKIAAAKQSEQGRFGQNPNRVSGYPDLGYLGAARGVMVEKGQENNEEKLLIFQFNPETIQDQKAVNMGSKSYLGFNYNDYVWSSGGERILTFKLQFEATAGVNTPHFGFDTTYGNDAVEKLATNFPRGTLGYVEKLQAFQYPKNPDPNKPIFANGGHIPSPKFMPPPIVILAHGNYYLEGVVTDVNVTHSLWNDKLMPLRSECDIQFKVLEQTQIQVKNIITKISKGGESLGGDNFVPGSTTEGLT